MAFLHFVVDTTGTFLVGIFLLRFFLQLTRSNFRNPLAQVIVRFTNPLVMPLRRVIPGWGGIDNASLVSALLVQAAVLVVTALLFGRSGLSLPGVALGTVFSLVLAAISLYTILVIFRVLMSWFNRDPSNPLAAILTSLTEPLMAPARRLVPPVGGFDISPILVLLALQGLAVLLGKDLLPRLL